MNSTFMARPRLLLVAALLLVSSLLVACGADPTATTIPAAAPTVAAPAPTAATGGGAGTSDVAPTAPAGGAATDGIPIGLNEWAIVPASTEVAAGHQKFKVTNTGKFAHNYKIMVNGQPVGTATLKAGESATLETDLAAGTYDTLCALPGHKDKGMAGKLVVK